ncbi:MAG TPA: hypothetical protein DEP23_00790 [Ruminococcaceae bacterium]|nr:hypothetical protein [Oscillospiraceae bacterium]
MNQYLYPQNLKAQAKLWFWNLRDIVVIGIALLISVLALSQIGLFLPLALTLVYAFLTIQLDDVSVLDFIKRAVRFFITTQQYYTWKARIGS